MATGLIFLQDTFTGAAGRLDAHTPDVDFYARGWSIIYGSPGQIRLDGLGYLENLLAEYYYPQNLLAADADSQDYKIDAFVTINGTAASDIVGLEARRNDAWTGGYYFASINGAGLIRLYEAPATILGSYTIPSFSATTEYKLSLEAIGNVINVYLDDVVVLTYTAEQVITNITQANPAVVTIAGHGHSTGFGMNIPNAGGMTELDGWSGTITKIDANTFSLDGVNSVGYTAYVSGGQADTPFAGIPSFYSNNTNVRINSLTMQYDTYDLTSVSADRIDIEGRSVVIATAPEITADRTDVEARSMVVMFPPDLIADRVDVETRVMLMDLPTIVEPFYWVSEDPTDSGKLADQTFTIRDVATGLQIDFADMQPKASGHLIPELTSTTTPAIYEWYSGSDGVAFRVDLVVNLLNGVYLSKFTSPSTAWKPGTQEDEFNFGIRRKVGLSFSDHAELSSIKTSIQKLPNNLLETWVA